MSVSPIRVIKDSKGSRLIYIKYMEGLGSPKAIPNLDVKSRGPNHTTTLLPIIDYAQATLPYNFTGFAPIQLGIGYLLLVSLPVIRNAIAIVWVVTDFD